MESDAIDDEEAKSFEKLNAKHICHLGHKGGLENCKDYYDKVKRVIRPQLKIQRKFLLQVYELNRESGKFIIHTGN